ncbi:unnamed protein product [Mytilus edulis]|uniref:Methyltransferase domain-containing protein n=1 Tax=Mytilus edulis TaxID=6550 RepID=A0A8S3PT55_MYTED|nr:unnamed protein product [Mytilus edulis]
MASVSPNDTKPDVYEERFNNIVYSGVIALGVGLGHRVGLFRALTNLSEPETSQSIADHAGLNERYVREWLFSMAAAKIVFITDDNKYYIPADCKTKTSKSLFATMILATAPLTKDVEACFRSKDQSSAGYDFSKLEQVFHYMNQDGASCDGTWIEENIFPSKYKSRDKIRTILDIGCGTGKITANIANYLPNAKVVGIDVDQYAIETALKLKEDEELTNVEFYLLGGDNLKEEWTGRFDWITMLKVFHDLPNPGPCLEGAMRALKDDGVLTFHDPLCHSDPKLNVGSKLHASTLTLSCYICLPCSLSAPPAVGNGIGWGLENRAKYLRDNGLTIHGNESVEVIHCSKTLK